MTPVLCIVGRSGAGKTTLIESLIPALKKRGYRVGTIKHDVHGFEMDREGKDTWRHKKAGAALVLISSPTKLALIKDTDRDLSLEELREKFISDVDLIITEGYKAGTTLPKIEVYRESLGKGPLCTDDPTLIASVGDPTPQLKAPHFSPEDVQGLVVLIEEKLLCH